MYSLTEISGRNTMMDIPEFQIIFFTGLQCLNKESIFKSVPKAHYQLISGNRK